MITSPSQSHVPPHRTPRLPEGYLRRFASVSGCVAVAPYRLNAVIVGCGIAGLAAGYSLGRAGHRVTILEASSALSEIGAGIQLTPNASRLLIRWGLKNSLDTLGIKPQIVSFRRFDTGERVGMDVIGKKMEKEYGAPYYQIHRADFQRILHDLAKPYVHIHLNSRIASIFPNTPSPCVVLTSGETIHADLIIGADGIKSVTRSCIVPDSDAPTPTGDAAYRATISTDLFAKDPELKPLIDNPEATAWMGPGRHVVGYCLRGKKEYNLVMIHPDTSTDLADLAESWTRPGDVKEMVRNYEGWDPQLRKMQSMVTSVLRSRLMLRLPLKTWVHPGGHVSLIGDACHPMLPYRTQGAAMAVEDAAVLGNLFSRITAPSQIPVLLRAYEAVRRKRTSNMQMASLALQQVFHYPDGPEQQKRDAAMRQAMELTMKEARGECVSRDKLCQNPNSWVDKAKTDAVLGYDADKAADKWWSDHGSDIAIESTKL